MTPERMDWSDDERLYQPRIHSRRIRALHRIGEDTGEPMTLLVDRALDEFIVRTASVSSDSEGADSREP